MKSPRLVFFGTDHFSKPSLEALVEAGFNVVAVVTKPDAPVGRKRQVEPPVIKVIAKKLGIPVLQPIKPVEAITDLTRLTPDMGVVVSYGRILSPSLIAAFRQGLINVHASLLPKYRGASPIEAVILNGEARTGVSLMQIDKGLDTGPVYCQAELPLAGQENRIDLYANLSRLGAQLLIDNLPAIWRQQLLPIGQDHAAASVTRLIKKSQGQIDWTKPAERLEREVRAYLGWPGSTAQLDGLQVTITSAHTLGDNGPAGQAFQTPNHNLAVYCGQGALVLDRLKPAGKREMTGREFLAGHPIKDLNLKNPLP
jgi:methionyl-tRNA formyltransferase